MHTHALRMQALIRVRQTILHQKRDHFVNGDDDFFLIGDRRQGIDELLDLWIDTWAFTWDEQRKEANHDHRNSIHHRPTAKSGVCND